MKTPPKVFLAAFAAVSFTSIILPPASLQADSSEPVEIGDRLQIAADPAFPIESLEGDLALKLQLPEPKDVVFSADAPWEGNTSGYFTLFQDGNLFRLYYRGWAHDPESKKELRKEVTCYAESRDGLYWKRPELGLFDFEGSADNNIIWRGPASHNFTPFRDDNPDCPSEAKYKALGVGKGVPGGPNKSALYAFQSADGIHWSPLGEKPVIEDGAFDSQNLAFWDPVRKEYRAYWRYFGNGVRAIRTATSKDFLTWENQADLTYPEGTPTQHLYTNAIQPYYRAPGLLVGFPTRYLPDEGQRVEPILMTSRDGVLFHRWNDPVVPEAAPMDRQGNRSNYMTWGLLKLPGKPGELSVYATEAYYAHEPGRLRRFVYRLDGFVGLEAGEKGGEVVTRPLIFSGNHLALNFDASAGGGVLVEIRDAETGKPLEGFGYDEALPLTGDSVKTTVQWKRGHDVSSLAGKPVRLGFRMKKADLFSFRFGSQ